MNAAILCPSIATGKIRTPDQAEQLIQKRGADLIGMARALLADPDLPKKARTGQSDRIIWCTYGNVCKNLDETFHKVTCVLWPKGSLQAPESIDADPPVWPNGGANLTAGLQTGQIFLHWNDAFDNESIYGYEIYRSVNHGEYAHLGSVKRTTHYDMTVAGGNTYSYYIVAYDLAGNRSVASNTVECHIPQFSPTAKL